MLVYSRVPEAPETNGPSAPQTKAEGKAKAESKAKVKAEARAEAGIRLPDHIQTMVDAMNATVNDQVQQNEQAKVGHSLIVALFRLEHLV